MRTILCRALVVFAGAAILAACTSMQTVQTTSGQVYLSSYDAPSGRTATGFDKKIRRAASVEPILRFPARFGLARIERGRLTAIPQAEATAWLSMAKKLGPRYGELVAISPLVAELAAGDAGLKRKSRGWEYRPPSPLPVIQKIRLGAARQHVDVVLIYEVIGRSRQTATILSLADLSIIGAFIVPSREIKAKGYASALLVDVRNGYPYGTEQATVSSSGLTPTIGRGERSYALGQNAKTAAVIKLTGKVEKMMGKLYAQLATLRARKSRTK